jgi:hypothetical protein
VHINIYMNIYSYKLIQNTLVDHSLIYVEYYFYYVVAKTEIPGKKLKKIPGINVNVLILLYKMNCII